MTKQARRRDPADPRVYNVPYRFTGNLRQLRHSLQLTRERWHDKDQHFRLWEQCPGSAAPHLSIEQFALCFLLRRHEKRYRKTTRAS
jgi:hypothetical protein